MAETNNNLPPVDDDTPVTPPPDDLDDGDQVEAPSAAPPSHEDRTADDDLKPRLERLGGEPAPDITPEEFARLQQAGQIHIDPRGRVRATQRDETDAGISLRKRRAWYATA
jgi:hypothetical protein